MRIDLFENMMYKWKAYFWKILIIIIISNESYNLII